MFGLKEEKIRQTPPVVRWLILAACLSALWAGPARALGTPAGTTILNRATVTYSLGSNPARRTATAFDSFEVLEIIDAVVTWQDATPVAVGTPHTDGLLTFLLTNTGNGPEAFALTVDDTLAGDDFDPDVQTIWLETNGIPGLQTAGNADTLYAGSTAVLPADTGVIIYVLGNIPAGLADNDRGDLRLAAGAQTPGAAGQPAGTLLAGAGAGVDALVGISQAHGEAVGTYEVSGEISAASGHVSVTLDKSIAQILDPFGGQEPSTGARVTYRIAVDVTGSGRVEDLVVTDLIPSGMTYVAGSIVLDGVPQTDAADVGVDSSEFSASTVTVDLGDPEAPVTFIIDFDTTIN